MLIEKYMRVKEINLEEGMTTVDDALMYLKSEVANAKLSKVKCLYINHVYGSSGREGAIRTKARQWLNAHVRNGKIKAVINGEDFQVTNLKALEMKNKFLELEQLFRVTNHGVTIVEL